MAMITRRRFGGLLTTGAAMMAAPAVLRAAGTPRVVIIGGGAGGASAARHLGELGGGRIAVTLIEPAERYATCFFSNLYLGGERSFESLLHGYGHLVSELGIEKITASAVAIDRASQMVETSDGQHVAYDRLIVAPGIDFIWDSVPGYSQQDTAIAPHAWKAGPQTKILKERIEKISDGGQIIIVPPVNPYRCPPAPYERASMMAYFFKKRGIDAKIIILDPKDKFSKQGLFQRGWEAHYPGMIEWYGPAIHGGILNVNAAEGLVDTDFDTFRADLLNIIPAQQAGDIAVSAALADTGAFCPIEANSMRSARDPNIFIIGDTADAGDMPKGAYAAGSQAQVAVEAIIADLSDQPLPEAHYANTCWSIIEPQDAVRLAARFVPGAEGIHKIHETISQNDENAQTRKATYEEALVWYDTFTGSIFGD